MRNTKSITITTALAALVILASISFSDASQTLIKHGAKGKYKHTLVKHRVKGKHSNASFQAFAKSGMEEEYAAIAPWDSLWFMYIPDSLYVAWHKSDLVAELKRDRDGILGGTGSPIDTVAPLGPFNVGGLTSGLLVSSANNNIFFACAPISGGLWKSTNAGAFWLPVDTPTITSAWCIAENPFHPDTIYVGASGVYKSTDGGNTFSYAHIGSGPSIACDQADGNTVYAGNGSGLERSTNGGSTWSVAPGTTGTIWNILALPSGAVFIVKSDSGIYMATNGKTGSFTKVTSATFPSTVHHVKLANCKSFPNIVFAAFDNLSIGLQAFCRSSDGGVTWTAQTIPSGLGIEQQAYGILLGVSNTDSNRVICGIQFQSYSTDGGNSWNSDYGMGHADMHSIASFSGSNQFLTGSDGGVYLRRWDSIDYRHSQYIDSNYVTTLFYGGDFAGSGRRCIGGTQDNSTIRIVSNTAAEVACGDGFISHINQQDSNIAYTQCNGTPLERSTNFFSLYPSWTTITPPWSGEGKGWNNFYQINYADGKQIYIPSTKGIWRTIDTGHSWTKLNSATIAGIKYIGCTPVTNPSIYFDGYDGTNRHFYRIDTAQTAPAGGTPVDLSATLPNTVDPMGEIEPYPPNPSTLYIGFIGSSTNPHAWKVLNANTSSPTWINISGTTTPLPSKMAVDQIYADPSDSTTLIAGTAKGVYYSSDGGADWYNDKRLPQSNLNEIRLRASDRKLFVFYYGRGVWYCSLAPHTGGIVQQASVSPTPATPQLEFNLYPNPATQKLTVSPQQELSSSARIAIYSSDGRMISESAWNPTGEVNIGSLPSGVYFLQITDGNLIAKNKFVKM